MAAAFTLADLLRAHARDRPERPALVAGERRLTYAELHERSSRAANALRAAGVRGGDRAALLVRNTAEFYEVVFAAAKLDAVVVALNWRLAAPEIAAILADARPRALFADPEDLALVPTRPPTTVCLGEEYERWLDEASPDDPGPVSRPESVVLQLYSSGTTGVPKGAMLTNANLSWSANMARERFGIGGESTNMVVSPLFHIGGAGYGLMAFFDGGRTVIMRDARPEHILEIIERERVTHAFLVPAVIQSMAECPDAARRDLSSLMLISYGAAPMSEALLRQALQVFACDFLGVYGMTETAGTVIALAPRDHVPDGPRARLLRSVGRPLPWLQIRIADLESGEELGPGEVGEIWVRSGQNMKGYFKAPEATEKTLVAGGWLRSGDAAYRDQDGYVFLHDRIKDMVISGGENVYPAEVENALAAHPAVAEVAVIGVPHARWGETVKAIVVRRPEAEADAEELREFTGTRLARYKCPTSVDFVTELPRTASGKVMKQTLRAAYRNQAR